MKIKDIEWTVPYSHYPHIYYGSCGDSPLLKLEFEIYVKLNMEVYLSLQTNYGLSVESDHDYISKHDSIEEAKGAAKQFILDSFTQYLE